MKTVFFSLLTLLLPLIGQELVEQKRVFSSMGTFVELSFCGTVEAVNQAFKDTENAFKEVEKLANLFDKNSELSQLNKTASQHAFVCSKELFELIEESQKAYKQSNKAFDITSKPLMELWGFYFKKRRAAPTAKEINKTLLAVGFDKLRIDKSCRSVYFTHPDMSIDLGGIAKGYAIDKAYERVSKKLISGFINLGGNIRVIPRATPYIIGLQDPNNRQKVTRRIELYSGAVSTSGSYEKFVTYNNKEYSHIIDPRTGYPVNRKCATTEIAPTATQADWLSTAKFIGY